MLLRNYGETMRHRSPRPGKCEGNCVHHNIYGEMVRPVIDTIETFLNIVVFFYGEGLLAPRPTARLEDHPLSAVRDCLFNIFAAVLHTKL
jgi:hypothetical protein